MAKNNQAGKKRTKKTHASGKPWYLWAGIAGGIVVVVGLVGVLIQHNRNKSRAKQTEASLQEPSKSPATPAAQAESPRRPMDSATNYPRIPADVTVPPDWLLADAPFDLKKIYALIPPDENAAPLYLEALGEFSAEVADCFPEDQRQAIRDQARQRGREFAPVHSDWSAGKRVSPAAIDQVLAAYEPGLEKLARAQQRPRCVFETGITITALLPHTQAIREVARVAQLRNARDLERGELRRPIRTLDLLLRLTRDLQIRAPTICYLVGAAIESIAGVMVREILNAPACTKEYVDQLRAVLVRHEQASQADPLAESYVTEYVMTRMSLHELEHRTGSFSQPELEKSAKSGKQIATPGGLLAGITGGSAQQLDAQLALMTEADFRKQVVEVNHCFPRVADAARRPYGERTTAMNEASSPLKKQVILAALCPNLETINLAITRGQTARRGALCLLAVRRWQLENQSAPPDLATVVKAAGINAIPVDPFSGKPMLLADSNSEPVVYSVGKDGRDDKALRDWDYGKQDGDYIFRLSDKSR